MDTLTYCEVKRRVSGFKGRVKTFQEVQEIFDKEISPLDLLEQVENSDVRQLDYALHNQSVNLKLIHPIFILRYARMATHHRETPFNVVGLDIETNYKTGEPRMLGMAYGAVNQTTTYPTLEDFYKIVKGLIDNSPGTNIVVWGSLDIQAIMRLFNPSELERHFISRGIAGSFKGGEFVATPPCLREVEGDIFFIDHYISGRSLRLGMVFGDRAYSLWVYNLSQFFTTTIADTAKTEKLGWIDFEEDTHLIDWERFQDDKEYQERCVASNRQDAVTVRELCFKLQDLFHNVFKVYPKLLVSTGSLADAAVSSMLEAANYESNSWRWLRHNAFVGQGQECVEIETLLAEAYSAGYVDQFAMGYFHEVHTADIAAAYPDKIRKLPDLREARLVYGEGNLESAISELEGKGVTVFTAAIRGIVTIPKSLKFHPITVKTPDRQNVRLHGKFPASYLLEERRFCARHGARFENEEFVIVTLRKEALAPIANVSIKLRNLREEFTRLRELVREADNQSEFRVLDGMQNTVKVIDNSLYGKTVMTVPIVENVNEVPQIVGMRAGDRYNMLYGSVITARTRIQIADACMQIEKRNGKVCLAMTDSVYWVGPKDALPDRYVRESKTAGYFEPPKTYWDFYLVKTGQYEYRDAEGKFYHKLRGLNVPYKLRNDRESFYRNLIRDFCENLPASLHPSEIAIPIPTRKLVTIGSHDLEHLAMVEDGMSDLRPFALTSKQDELFVWRWKQCIDGHIWLNSLQSDERDSAMPLRMLHDLYVNGDDFLSKYQWKRAYYHAIIIMKGDYKLPKKLTLMNWEELEAWGGITRETLGL